MHQNLSYHSLKSILSKNKLDPRFCNVCGCVCCHKVFPQRYCMTLMLVAGLSIAYMQRVGLNLAIVKMTATTQAMTDDKICPSSEDTSTADDKKLNDKQFDWDETVHSYILLSFYIGYLVGSIPAGLMTDWWGARWFLFAGCGLSTLTTGIIPPLAYYCHWSTIVAARIVAGLGQSTIYPGASSLITRWIPDDKKSSIASIVMTSFTLGTMLGNLFTGYIIQWTNTWCWVYYTFTIAGVIWLGLFYFYVYSDPYQHPHVTKRELQILDNQIKKQSMMKMPIRSILTDVALWSMIIGQFGNDYTLFTVLTNMPKYFITVLNINTHMTGTLLMAPPFACFLGSFLFGFTADALIGKKLIKKVNYRILATIIASPISTMFMILMTFMECNKIAANILLCMTMFAKSAFYSGLGMSPLDISHNYSGLLLGFCTASGSLAGMIAPYIIGNLAYNNTFPEWMLIQYVSLGVSVVTLIPYLMFAKANRKEWDYGPDDEMPETVPDEGKPNKCKRIMVCYRPE